VVSHQKAIFLLIPRSLLRGVFISRLDPTDEYDLLENTVPSREPSPECRGLIQIAIAKLPLKLREVFLQFHFLKLTQAEIARQYDDVDTRTIRNWLAEAKAILGISGGEHDA
jgi:DNA-directed RNA polymerase specialized sigma24 family protein